MSNSSRKSAKKAIVDFTESLRSSERTQSSRSLGRSQPNDETLEIGEEVIADANSTETQVLISNCIRYILLNENRKTLIKQGDLNKFIADNFSLNRQNIAELMKMVADRLLNDFGFSLVEVPDANTKSYILHTIYKNNLIYLDENEEFESSTDSEIQFNEDDIPMELEPDGTNEEFNIDVKCGISYDDVMEHGKRCLLLMTLSLIFLEDNFITEEELFKNLEDIGLDIDLKNESAHDSNKHSIREVISKEFTREGYLKRTKRQHPNASTQYIYQWSTRADLEFKKSDILKFIKDIFNGNDVELLIKMHQD